MNKNQLIVVWIFGLLLAGCFILSSLRIEKEAVYQEPTPKEKQTLKATNPNQLDFSDLLIRTEKYSYVIKQVDFIRITPAILILGSLLIYTLRDKKK